MASFRSLTANDARLQNVPGVAAPVRVLFWRFAAAEAFGRSPPAVAILVLVPSAKQVESARAFRFRRRPRKAPRHRHRIRPLHRISPLLRRCGSSPRLLRAGVSSRRSRCIGPGISTIEAGPVPRTPIRLRPGRRRHRRGRPVIGVVLQRRTFVIARLRRIAAAHVLPAPVFPIPLWIPHRGPNKPLPAFLLPATPASFRKSPLPAARVAPARTVVLCE